MTDQSPLPTPRRSLAYWGGRVLGAIFVLIAAVLRWLLQDGAALAGASLITYGVSRIYAPAAYIVAGLFLLVGAWLLARKGDA